MSEILNIFTVISSIGTAVSATIACIALRSLKKQRETTYIPDLILERCRFYGYSYVKNELPYPDEWSEEDRGFEYEAKETNSSLQLKLHNIGLGAAKYITASFDFDIIQSIKLIKSEMAKIPEDLRVNVIINQKMLEIKPSSENTPFGASVFTQLKFDQTINHILPSNVAKPTTLPLSPHYLKFISLSIYLMWATKPTEGANISIMTLIDLPPLILTLEYFDIANQKHYKKFELTFSMNVSSLKKVDGYFNVKEVNCS